MGTTTTVPIVAPAPAPTQDALVAQILAEIAALKQQFAAQAIQGAVHGPYEDLAIKGLEVLEKIIDGMSVDQKVKAWQNWFDFWQPLFDAAKALKP
jgi:hypothetical protein